MPRRNAFWGAVGVVSIIVGAFNYGHRADLISVGLGFTSMVLGAYIVLRNLPMGGD